MSDLTTGTSGVIPTLTLDAPDVPTIMPATQPIVEKKWSDDTLTPEEMVAVEEFATKINVKDTNTVMSYGSGAQKKMSDFSSTALNNVKNKDMGEVGGLLTDVVGKLKGFDMTEQKGFFGKIKSIKNQLSAMKEKYTEAEVSVNKIVATLESHQATLLKDCHMLDMMYEENLVYFKELSMYILAGKKKLAEVREKDLVELHAKAQASGKPEDAQAAKDLDDMCLRFEKKIHDLELTRTISIQTAPQIRLVQNNDTMMIEKIQSTIVNTIPLWKQQMVLALGLAHSQQAIKAQSAVTDMTNELLKKNADTLKIATVETAKASERGIVDMETLKHTNSQLISTLDEVAKIQDEGKAKRAQAEVELGNLETELKAKLLEMRN